VPKKTTSIMSQAFSHEELSSGKSKDVNVEEEKGEEYSDEISVIDGVEKPDQQKFQRRCPRCSEIIDSGGAGFFRQHVFACKAKADKVDVIMMKDQDLGLIDMDNVEESLWVNTRKSDRHCYTSLLVQNASKESSLSIMSEARTSPCLVQGRQEKLGVETTEIVKDVTANEETLALDKSDVSPSWSLRPQGPYYCFYCRLKDLKDRPA